MKTKRTYAQSKLHSMNKNVCLMKMAESKDDLEWYFNLYLKDKEYFDLKHDNALKILEEKINELK